MEQTRTITYDDRSTGRRVIGMPPDLPFADLVPRLLERLPGPQDRDTFARIAARKSISERAAALAELLSGAADPLPVLLSAVALAAEGDVVGIRLLYGALLVVPPLERLVGELAGFENVKRVMRRVQAKQARGDEIPESDVWFEKKVRMLSTAHPLPGGGDTDPERPWLSWESGVARAIADPDPRWREAVRERAATELQAARLRIRHVVAVLDPDAHVATMRSMLASSEDLAWRAQVLEAGDGGGSPLYLRRELEGLWDGMMDRLAEENCCPPLAELFANQERKQHSFPRLRAGTAVLRAVLMHPSLRRTSRAPDFPSCLSLFAGASGDGVIECLTGPGKNLDTILGVSGFSMEDRVLCIDLGGVPGPVFVGSDEAPLDVDWIEIDDSVDISYKSLVMAHIDDDTFLAELLNNPKAIMKPGVVSIIALRCRSSRILGTIANRRELYTGFLNKEVPVSLLSNPSRIPLSSLRKFIHVRYVDRMTLQRLATRKGQIREEVRREIERYLNDR